MNCYRLPVIHRPLNQLILILTLILNQHSVMADGKLLATSGATSLEGAAGGGIVPWAVIGSYGTEGEWGGQVAHTQVHTGDFTLRNWSGSIGIDNRIELSAARQRLHVEPLNTSIRQDIVGLKVRLTGDLIYTDMPQISLAVQHKRNLDSAIPYAVGASDDNGTDYLISASKLWLGGAAGYNLLVNTTFRYSNANQIGLLGFGGDTGNRQWLLETSGAIFMNRHWAVGAEFRQKPDHLSAVKEDHWKDVFVGYFPNKHWSAVMAYSDLGDIAGLTDQKGWYLSLQYNH